jgi:hypothetical protein
MLKYRQLARVQQKWQQLITAEFRNRRWLEFTRRSIKEALGWGWTEVLFAKNLGLAVTRGCGRNGSKLRLSSHLRPSYAGIMPDSACTGIGSFAIERHFGRKRIRKELRERILRMIAENPTLISLMKEKPADLLQFARPGVKIHTTV